MKLFLTAFILTALQLHLNAQVPKPDSANYYLNQVKGMQKKDSVLIFNAFQYIKNYAPDSIQTENALLKINELKNNISPDFYDALSLALAINYSNNNLHSKSIDELRIILTRLTNYKTSYQRYLYLTAILELRIPYRNCNRTAEGIELYLDIANKALLKNDSTILTACYYGLRSLYATLGLKDKAIYYQLKSMQYLNPENRINSNYYLTLGNPLIGPAGLVTRKSVLAGIYNENKQPAKALPLAYEAVQLNETYNLGPDSADLPFALLQILHAKVELKDDSIGNYIHIIDSILYPVEISPIYRAIFYKETGLYYLSKNEFDSAFIYLSKSKTIRDTNHLYINTFAGNLNTNYYLANVLLQQKKYDDAIKILKSEIVMLRNSNLNLLVIEELSLLADAYNLTGDYKNATQTLFEYKTLINKLHQQEAVNRNISFDIEQKIDKHQASIKMLEAENESNRRLKFYLIIIVGLTASVAVILYILFQSKKKSNAQLAKTLNDLKNTQEQLIQNEKLASLGALTAGIAHEIKNPLNFVNNFSELSNELIKEYKESTSEEERNEILNDLEQNLTKINHHGKRADSIVQGMLQHARTGKAEKHLTDINKMCDEFLSLAYHGMRAKDQSFNCEIKKSFDNSLPELNLVSQDISRILVNILNNAFYAVRKKIEAQLNVDDYKPQVTLTTQRLNNKILISIRDNGNGIPESIRQKIFEPFFTTKPTGEGTGLGLSICNDIIKAHGGELKVESKAGEVSEFIIMLPII